MFKPHSKLLDYDGFTRTTSTFFLFLLTMCHVSRLHAQRLDTLIVNENCQLNFESLFKVCEDGSCKADPLKENNWKLIQGRKLIFPTVEDEYLNRPVTTFFIIKGYSVQRADHLLHDGTFIADYYDYDGKLIEENIELSLMWRTNTVYDYECYTKKLAAARKIRDTETDRKIAEERRVLIDLGFNQQEIKAIVTGRITTGLSEKAMKYAFHAPDLVGVYIDYHGKTAKLFICSQISTWYNSVITVNNKVALIEQKQGVILEK